mmetsp:Transcript_37769/g.122841  ORF Transcript_37769/g.122841 Transcript_37769/m.122841 type:complete len:201 (+) Transcript_37769:230-832(+)
MYCRRSQAGEGGASLVCSARAAAAGSRPSRSAAGSAIAGSQLAGMTWPRLDGSGVAASPPPRSGREGAPGCAVIRRRRSAAAVRVAFPPFTDDTRSTVSSTRSGSGAALLEACRSRCAVRWARTAARSQERASAVSSSGNSSPSSSSPSSTAPEPASLSTRVRTSCTAAPGARVCSMSSHCPSTSCRCSSLARSAGTTRR